jgi:imidazole glycerol-phosphate synthase subunit HisH
MKPPRVAIIDYGMGNLYSVTSALEYLGCVVELVSDPHTISSENIIVLPGVGSYRVAMETIRERGIDEALLHATKVKGSFLLGICLGMQLLGSSGNEDGESIGLGFVGNKVERFLESKMIGLKLPHVGFNEIKITNRVDLFYGLPDSACFYFNHSYRMLSDGIIKEQALCSYGEEFLAAFKKDNICGAQFHPEKSQNNGLVLLKNFLEMACKC